MALIGWPSRGTRVHLRVCVRKAPHDVPAASSPDAEILRLGADFDRAISEGDALWNRFLATAEDSAEADALGKEIDKADEKTERAASRIMTVPPVTLAGLSLWARVMLWRIDADIRDIPAEAPEGVGGFGANEAFALAAAIERMASHAAAS